MSSSRKSPTNPLKNRTLRLENLENRINQAVAQVWFSGNMLVFKTDNNATDLTISNSGSNVKVTEGGSNRTWQYGASGVGSVQMQGGNGNDRFVNNISKLPVSFYGNGGNDYLEGYDAKDYLSGGDGNDTIKGYGGDDTIFGGAGNDTLLGMSGDDQIVGEGGNDHLNGRDGTDKLWGGDGDDVLINVDNGTSDYAEGGAGRDTYWVDQNASLRDQIFGAMAEDKIQSVVRFSNSADKTLDGDRIADPKALRSGETYKTFAGKPLFAADGPNMNDVDQGSLGDCYLLAGLSAIAMDNKMALQQNVVDFDDGTYGVRFGDSFYRVDNDLVVSSSSSTTPAYAGITRVGNSSVQSMWVAVVEKAWAHYRTGGNSFASIEGGWSIEVNKAFGSTISGEKSIQSYTSATALANDLYDRWNTYQAVTIGFTGVKSGGTQPANLVLGHMYTVARFNRNSSGTVTSVVLRNPWGTDGGSGSDGANDGYVTLTPTQLMNLVGRVNWGRV